MIPYLKAFFTDENAFQRLAAILILGLGSILASGGVVPGTDYVFTPLAGPNLANLGKLILLLGGPAALAGGGLKPKL